MSDLPTPDTSNYDGTFDNEPTYWQLADPLLNDQAVQKWVLPVPDGTLQTRDELIDTRLQAIADAWNEVKEAKKHAAPMEEKEAWEKFEMVMQDALTEEEQ